MKMTTTYGNVFLALGFPPEEAENLKIRSDLMNQLEQLIKSRGLTQVKAAKLFGVSQPRVSDLTRGRIDRFSVDTLIGMLWNAGLQVTIVTRPRPQPRRKVA